MVRKKNGVDIRLCIEYKLVNAVTVGIEYAMPRVDDQLTRRLPVVLFTRCCQRVPGRDDDRVITPRLCLRVRVRVFRVASYAIRA